MKKGKLKLNICISLGFDEAFVLAKMYETQHGFDVSYKFNNVKIRTIHYNTATQAFNYYSLVVK